MGSGSSENGRISAGSGVLSSEKSSLRHLLVSSVAGSLPTLRSGRLAVSAKSLLLDRRTHATSISPDGTTTTTASVTPRTPLKVFLLPWSLFWFAWILPLHLLLSRMFKVVSKRERITSGCETSDVYSVERVSSFGRADE